jgi:hypothetical protein
MTTSPEIRNNQLKAQIAKLKAEVKEWHDKYWDEDNSYKEALKQAENSIEYLQKENQFLKNTLNSVLALKTQEQK